MNTKAFFPCAGGSNLILGIGMENHIFVCQMGRLCGAAHGISGIPAPLCLCGGWLEGSWGGWLGAGVAGGMVGGVLVRGRWVWWWCVGGGWGGGMVRVSECGV